MTARPYWGEERDPFSFSPNWMEPPPFEIRMTPAQVAFALASAGALMAFAFTMGAALGWAAARAAGPGAAR